MQVVSEKAKRSKLLTRTPLMHTAATIGLLGTAAAHAGVINASVACGTLFALGHLWRFPTPLGYIWASSMGIPAVLLFTVHEAIGLRVAFRPQVRRKMVAPLLLAQLPAAFVLVFSMYRVVFAGLWSSRV